MPIIGAFVATVFATFVGMIAAATTGESPFLTLAVALVGGGVVTAYLNNRARSRSGEGAGAAANSVADGAQKLVDASESLMEVSDSLRLPLQREIAKLNGVVHELELKLADARAESGKASADRHELRGELASLAAQLALANIEIETLRVQVGSDPGRRQDDPPGARLS